MTDQLLVSRELLERFIKSSVQGFPCDWITDRNELRTLLAQPTSEPKPVGYRVRFIKEPDHWMVNFKKTCLPEDKNEHCEYELLFTHPAPAVVLPERHGDRCDSSEGEAYQSGWNACLDEVARLNGVKP